MPSFDEALVCARAARSFAPLSDWLRTANPSPEQLDVLATLSLGDQDLEDQARAAVAYRDLRTLHGYSKAKAVAMIHDQFPKLSDHQIDANVVRLDDHATRNRYFRLRQIYRNIGKSTDNSDDNQV